MLATAWILSAGVASPPALMNTIKGFLLPPPASMPLYFRPGISAALLPRYSPTARPGVSSRYTFVSTAQVVALLQDEGGEPVKASEQRVRLESRQGFQMHEQRFARRGA